MASNALRRFIPMFDRVLIERAEAMTKTKGGIMIPEKAQAKVLQGTVVAVGPGLRTEQGQFVSPSVKVGDQVLLPDYGGTKVEVEDKEYYLFREVELLAKIESE